MVIMSHDNAVNDSHDHDASYLLLLLLSASSCFLFPAAAVANKEQFSFLLFFFFSLVCRSCHDEREGKGVNMLCCKYRVHPLKRTLAPAPILLSLSSFSRCPL